MRRVREWFDLIPTRGRVALGVAACAGIAVAVIAIAGGGSSGTAESAPLGAKPPPAAKGAAVEKSDESKSERKSTRDSEHRGDEEKKKDESSDSGLVDESLDSPEEVREAIKDIPEEELTAFTRQAAINTLASMGYPNSAVSLNPDRSVVVITISREYACGTTSSDVGKIAKAVKKILTFVDEVRVYVADAGGPIETYVAANCTPLEVPEAEGEEVWSESGTGIRGSEEFAITARRWTVSYVNGGGALEIYVNRGKELLKPVIDSERRESGKQTYKGPGKFNLTATGSGNWEVHVYNGT